MNTLETWRSIIEVLGWTLIHFTWQGTLVALSLAGVLQVLRGASTNTRYAAACVALLLMASLPLFTITIISLSTHGKTASAPPPQFVAQPASDPQPVEIEQTIVLTQTDIASASPRPWLFIRPAPIKPLLPWMILLWLLGVVFFSLRLVGGWLYTQLTDRTAAVEPLIATLSDEDSWVRVAAAYSLGEMRYSRATESLVAALGDAEWSVRGMAARALGKMKAHAAVERLKSLSLRDENEEVRRKAVQALGEIGESPTTGSTDQVSSDLKFNVRLTGMTRTFEWSLRAPEGPKMAQLKINGQIKSGGDVWTLRDPNGKSVFTAESGKAELSLDSGDLNVIPGTWTLQVEFKNSTLDCEVHWSTR